MQMESEAEGCLITEDLALQPGILHANRDVLYNKEDWTDKVSTLHRAAFTMYSNLLIEDPGCVSLSETPPRDQDAMMSIRQDRIRKSNSYVTGVSTKELVAKRSI